MRMHLYKWVCHSLTVTKMQDQTRKITGIILDWFGKVWVVNFGLVSPSLVWFGLVKFHLVPFSIPILIPIQIPVTFPIKGLVKFGLVNLV